MIDGVGKAGPGRLGLVRSGVERSAEIGRVADAVGGREGAAPTTAAAELASAGAPVDSAKVAAIRAAIAEGRYPVEPDKIAASMIAIDLPLFDGK
jgi:negative regulator of flagellin synthesis FlgM